MENNDRKRYEALANFRMYKFVLWILFSFFLGVFAFYVLDTCDVFPPNANRAVVPDEILTRKDAYELFDKQFTHLLTTFGIMLSVFGIALPVISYFFQRVSLRDEREAIQHEIEVGMNNIKERENKLRNELEKIKQSQQETQQTLENANISIGKAELAEERVGNSLKQAEKLHVDIINLKSEFYYEMHQHYEALGDTFAAQPTTENKKYYFYCQALFYYLKSAVYNNERLSHLPADIILEKINTPTECKELVAHILGGCIWFAKQLDNKLHSWESREILNDICDLYENISGEKYDFSKIPPDIGVDRKS